MKQPTCPYIGLADNSSTNLSFPSEGNFCHHASPVAPVKLEHQERFCLTAQYSACPVYQMRTRGPLPPAIAAAPAPRIAAARINRSVWVPVLLLLALALLGVIGLASARSGWTLIPSTGDNDSKPNASMPGFLLLGSTSTVTVSPPETAVPTVAQRVANCALPVGYTMYIVNPTDLLFRLSVLYGTSVEALQQANCMGRDTVILPGQVIYVPILPTPTLTFTATVRYIIPTSTPQPREEQPRPQPPAATPVPNEATPIPPTATAVPPSPTPLVPTPIDPTLVPPTLEPPPVENPTPTAAPPQPTPTHEPKIKPTKKPKEG